MCVCVVVYGRMWSKGARGRGCGDLRLLHGLKVNAIRGYYEGKKISVNVTCNTL